MNAILTEEDVEQIKASEPVFVWALSARCGTTLLQRLISSSGEILMFGEDGLMTQYLPAFILDVTQHSGQIENATELLAGGDYTNWVPNALAEPGIHRKALVDGYYRMLQAYQESAQKYDYGRWGTKQPELKKPNIEFIQQLLPNSKHIFLYRHIHDVVKSNKARKFVKDLEDVYNLCRKWAGRLKTLMEDLASDPQNLPVKFESLVNNKHQETNRISDFINVEQLDLEVFEHKVNTWPGYGDGHSPDQYIEPEPLTDKEMQLVQKIPDDVMRMAGYQFRQKTA